MNSADSLYINRLRGGSILRVVLGHLGLGWILLPYSSYIGIFLSVLFFCSGYVFIYLFNRSAGIFDFISKRILGIVLPFYLIYSLALIASYILGYEKSGIEFRELFQILILAPDIQDMPYPLGQIWYLRVLVFCALICPFFFLLAKINRYFLLIPVVIGFIFAGIQTEYKFHRNFFFFGHNFFQEIVYGAYFFIGSFTYCTSWRNNKLLLSVVAILCLVIAYATLIYISGSSNLSHHAFAPNLFYFPLGIVGIILVLIFVSQIEWVFFKFNMIARLLDFCSKHSYGIYLNHSFFIIFYENIFGLKNVISNPGMAVLKVSLVLASSLLFAVPITYISKRLYRYIIRG